MLDRRRSAPVVRARRSRRSADLFLDLESRLLLTADLTGSFVSVPATAPGGSVQSATFKLSNPGDAALSGKLAAAVFVIPEGATFDKNTAAGAGTFSISGKLLAGTNADISLPFNLSPGLPAGNYRVVVILDPDNKVLEGDESNNTIQSGLFAITQPNYDLSGAITAKSKLPSSLILGAAASGSVSATIVNNGTTALPKGLSVPVTVVARPTDAVDNSQDLVISKPGAVVSVSGLTSTRSKSANIQVTFPSSLAAGTYDIILIVDSSAGVGGAGAVAETNESNNEAAFANTLTVASPFVDLDVATVTDAFADTVLGGSTANGSVTILNSGNVKASGSVNVIFYASTTGQLADGVVVGQKSFSVSLNPGQTSSNLTQPITLPTGDSSQLYTLFAKIVPTGFTDTNAANDSQQGGAVTASPATVDLHLLSATNPFSSSAPGGSTGTGVVRVENLGTASATGSVTVTYYASTTDSIEGATPIGATTLNLSLAPGKASGSINVALTLPNPETTTAYNIIAVVSALDPLVDNNPGNNATAILGSVSATHLSTVWDNFGDTITFKSDPGHPIGSISVAGEDTGTFRTNTGTTGIYHFTWTSAGGIGFFTFNDGSPNGVTKAFSTTYISSAFFWGKHTVVFSHDSSGAKGQFELNGQTIFFK